MAAVGAAFEFLRLLRRVTGERCRISFSMGDQQKALEDDPTGGATAPEGVGILCGGGSTVSTISFFSPIAAAHEHMRCLIFRRCSVEVVGWFQIF